MISKKLLESELAEKNGNELYQSYIAKEMEVIKKLDIAFCDMTGDLEAVSKRLENCEVIIVPKGTYSEMQDAMIFRQTVKNILLQDEYNAQHGVHVAFTERCMSTACYPKKNYKINFFENDDDLITRGAVYAMLHDLGGCDACEEWANGWDSAIDTAIKELDEIPTHDQAETTDCSLCKYKDRHQKCSCCKRNANIKDCYEMDESAAAEIKRQICDSGGTYG